MRLFFSLIDTIQILYIDSFFFFDDLQSRRMDGVKKYSVQASFLEFFRS